MNKYLFGVALFATLSGCATYDAVDRTAKSVNKSAKVALDLAESVRATKQPPQRDTVVFDNNNWVSPRPIEIRKQSIPDELRCQFAFNVEKSPIDILEFTQTITKICHIPARVTPDAIQAIRTQGLLLSSGGVGGATGQTVGAGTMPVAGVALPQLPSSSTNMTGLSSVNGNSATSLGGRVGMIDFKYQGELKPALDMVAQRLGVSWKYVDNGISFFYLDTKVFNFATMALTTDFSSSVQSGMTSTSGTSGGSSGSSGSSSGISGSSGSQQSATVTMKTSKWEDVTKAIQSILTPNVGRLSVSPSSGTITVTDTYEVLGRVERFLDSENKTLTKQVLLNIKVLAVTVSDADGLGIDWNLVYKSLSGNFGLNLLNSTTSDPSAISTTFSVLPTAKGNTQQFAGSSAVISALARQGHVSVLRSPSVTTLNMHSVPIQIGSQVSYIAQSQTTNTAQVGSTTSLTPGTVTTGFNMILLPYVLPDNRMLLESSINISSLQRIRSVTSAGTTIEVPEVNNQIFSQTARIQPGETLILSGFEQMTEEANKTGVGTPNNILLGGSVNSNKVRDVIVVLITPIIKE